jgi:hypothetical protein
VVLSRELADFILAFSGAFQKFVMYPAGHPALEGAVRAVFRKLEVIFLERNALALGVTPTQLIISGVPTDPKHVLLKDLAGNLHKRNIGGIKITRDVTRTELENAFAALAHERFATADDPHDESPSLPYWPHLRLYPLTYDHLELLEDEEEENRSGSRGGPEEATWSKRLWMNLARAAIGDDVSETDAADLDPAALAEAIAQRSGDDAYQEKVLSGLVDFAKSARSRGQAESAAVQRQLSKMLSAMTPDTAEQMLSLRGGDGARQRTFLMEASHILSADVVYRLVEASSHATSRDLSPALLAMLSKLSAHAMMATDGRRAVADDSFRELVRTLVDRWEETEQKQHLPELYGHDSKQLPELPDVTSSVLVYAPEPERIILMSIESGIVEAGTLRAVDWMMAKGQIDQLLLMLENLVDDPVAKVLHDRVYHPRTVSVLLASEPIGLDTLDRLIPEAGLEAAELLLDALAAANDRKVRSKLLELVARYGAAVGSEVATRIPGAPWFVQRNLLHLLGMLPSLPPEFSPELCLSHSDPRVRHEGLKLLLRDPATRDEAIAQAAQAPDLPSVRLGMVTAAEGCPPQAVGYILKRLRSRKLPEDISALAIRAVGGVEDEAVLDVLLGYVWHRRRLLWFQRMAPRSPTMIEALVNLAVHWRYHPKAATALKRGNKHRDKLIRQAAGARAEVRQAEEDPRLKVII